MNKSDLVTAIADQFGTPKLATDKVITAVFDHITKALAKGDMFQLIGFGTFSVKKRAARKGRNPATGELSIVNLLKMPSIMLNLLYRYIYFVELNPHFFNNTFPIPIY